MHTHLKPSGAEARAVFLENSGCDKCLDSYLSQDVSLRQVSETSLGTCNTLAPPAARKGSRTGVLGLYGQVTKRIRWMPWRSEAMKDVAACDKHRGVGSKLRSGDVRMGKPTAQAVSSTESIGAGSEPGELKYLSTRRKRNQPRFPQ